MTTIFHTGHGLADHLFAESLGQVARCQYFDGNAQDGLQFDLHGPGSNTLCIDRVRGLSAQRSKSKGELIS